VFYHGFFAFLRLRQRKYVVEAGRIKQQKSQQAFANRTLS